MLRNLRARAETPIADRARRLGVCVLLLGMASAAAVPATPRIARSVIRGRIIAVDSRDPVSGVKVKIKRLGAATTNSDGRYKIRVAREITGKWRVVISAPEYWRRKTWLVVAESARKVSADWNILPKNSAGFDLELFNAVTRRGSREGGTARWQDVPVFIIFANRLDCPGTLFPDENCPEWIVTSSAVSSTIMDWFLAAIDDVPALMGGPAPTVEIIRLPPGTSISTDSVLVPGAFTLGEQVGNETSAFPRHASSEVISSHVVLISQVIGVFDRGSIVRRVASGLGYLAAVAPQDLCAGLLNRGMSTVFCLSHGLLDPTDLDAAIGRALYTRAIGNRYPDIDPKPGGSP